MSELRRTRQAGQPSPTLYCPDPGRFSLFRDRLQDLGDWFRKPHTDPILADILEQYIFHRGAKTLTVLCQGQPELLKFVHSQDFIGWDHFLEDKIALDLTPLLRDHLLRAPTVLTVSDWKKAFISHLLQLTHGQ